MKYIKFLTLAIALFVTSNMNAQTTDKDVTIIELTQVEGDFETQNLDLVPGKYQFRIVNKDVEKEVGFLIQKAADAKKDPMQTAVENSFSSELIKKGEARYTGVVDLTKGEYVYSCPLNPTPHYKINVK